MGWGVMKEFGVRCANLKIMVIEFLTWIPTNLPLSVYTLSGSSHFNLWQKILGLKLIVI